MQQPGVDLDSVAWREVVARPLSPPAQARLLAVGADALDAEIDAVLEHAAHEVGAQRCALVLFDRERHCALRDRSWAAPGLAAPRLELLQLPWILRQLRAGRPVLFHRGSQLPLPSEYERATLLAAGIRSAILMPLCAASTVPLGWIGFMAVDAERSWKPSQVDAARRCSELLAAALLRLRAERERDEQVSTHAVLAEVSAAFLALPPERVVPEGVGAALHILARHLGAQRGSAWVLEEGGAGLQLISQWHDGAAARLPTQAMAHPGVQRVLRRHLRGSEPWCVSHLGELPPDSGETRALLEAWDVGALLAMPLRAGERELGWLSFTRPAPSSWPQPLVRRLRLAADLVSAALARAHDAERVRRAEHEAHGTRDLLQATLDALSAQLAITDAAGRILAVNEAWRRFDPEHAGATGVGADYLEVCRRARAAHPEAGLMLDAVPALLSGEQQELRLAYPCHTPLESRWFQLRVTCFALQGERRLVFAHEEVTELKLAEQRLSDLAGELVQVQDTERRRIASVLHDGAAQQVFAAMLGVRAARRAAHVAPQALEESQELLEQALLQLRTLSHLLHPPLLDEAGLGPALSAYVESFSARSGLALTLEAPPALERLAPEAEHALFRMVQEALLNVQRHSGSAQALVRVEQTPGEVCITVQDQGRGLPAAALHARPTVGLASMRQRLLQVGGTLELRSSASGTEVHARVPRGAPPR